MPDENNFQAGNRNPHEFCPQRDEDKTGCKTQKGVAVMAKRIKMLFNCKGQSIIEYAMVAAIVASAMIVMTTYVFRSVQSTQQQIEREFRTE